MTITANEHVICKCIWCLLHFVCGGYRKVGNAIAIYFIVKFYFAFNYIRLEERSFFVNFFFDGTLTPLQPEANVLQTYHLDNSFVARFHKPLNGFYLQLDGY